MFYCNAHSLEGGTYDAITDPTFKEEATSRVLNVAYKRGKR